MEPERTADVAVSEEASFSALMLSKRTLAGIQKCGFSRPSPIQLRAIPLGRCGFDLIVEAKSGTGKTAVFGIVALEMLNDFGGLQVIILAPTREIASQIGNVLKEIGCTYKDLCIETVMGGTNINDDISRLTKNKYQILVGSPGRVLHLIKIKAISTNAVRLFVLDEADKLMEESFQKEINYIFSQLPERKQTIAASATYTPELKEFLEKYMKMPSHIKPYSSSVLLGVVQKISIVPAHGSAVRQCKIKYDNLLSILSKVPFKQCLIFCRYQVRTEMISELLELEGWPVAYLASSQTQKKRLESLKKLQDFSCRILVATNLASRGIDASNVDLVINFDIPTNIATYLHRIGRSGRYGSKGMAITIAASGEEEQAFTNMINSLGDCYLSQFNKPLFDENSSSKKPISEVSKELISEVSNDSIDAVSKKVISQVSEEPISEFLKEPVLEVASSDVSKDPICEISKEIVCDVSKEPISEILEDPIDEVSKNTTIERFNTTKQKFSTADLISMMTLSPKEICIEPFDTLVTSFNEFVSNNSFIENNADTSIDDNISLNESLTDERIENYTNVDIKEYLNKECFSLTSFIKSNFNVKDTASLKKSVNVTDSLKSYSIEKTTLGGKKTNNDSVPNVNKNIVSPERESNSKIDIKNTHSNKKKDYVDKSFTDVYHRTKYNRVQNNDYVYTDNYIEVYEDNVVNNEVVDPDLADYLDFKRQLEIITNKIQYSVYITSMRSMFPK